jgi:hypothetical protein
MPAWMLAALVQDVWIADSMDKIFQDVSPPASPPAAIRIETARNEYESAQLVARGELKGVAVEFSGLEGLSLKYDLVGYVPVKGNLAMGAPIDVRRAPADFPDPFLEEKTIDVEAGRARPIWLTVYTPRDAAPGLRKGTVRVKAEGFSRDFPIEVQIWPLTIPDERHLKFTNWFNPQLLAKEYRVEPYGEEFYRILKPYLSEIAAHRQNIVWVYPGTIRTTREEDGSLSFEFSVFDRYVEELSAHGLVDVLEIAPIGSATKGQFKEAMDFHAVPVSDRKTGKTKGDRSRETLARWLRALRDHLKERGWLGKAMLHVADEPFPHMKPAYMELCEFVEKHAPGLRKIDAVIAPDLGGRLEVVVPQLALYFHWEKAFDRIRREGGELWYYTCVVPQGLFPNRFINQTLVQTRILHWINRRYHFPGYLHWGLNHWKEEPGLPAGDTHIIYPGREGPRGSIRWEAVRDGIEDYEYFWLLDQEMADLKKRLGPGADSFDPRAAGNAIAGLAVRGPVDYVRDAETLRGLRRRIVETIRESRSGPPLMVEVSPSVDEPVHQGFPLISVRGVTVPGAEAWVNNKKFTVREDGSFLGSDYVSGARPRITVKVAKDGQTATRNFEFRLAPEPPRKMKKDEY